MTTNPESAEKSTEVGRYTFLAENSVSTILHSPILIVARHPGAANYLAPVGHYFQNKAPLYFKTAGRGDEIFEKQFPNRIALPNNTLPSNLDWVLVSADMPVDFEIDAIKRARSTNPRCKLAVVEDYPGSISKLIDAITREGLHPNLVLATTRTQADIYQQRKDLRVCPVIPVGQPSFDPLLREQTLDLSKKTRERLEISDDAKVITYIGTPTEDGPAGMFKITGDTDLNSYILAGLANSLAAIATTHPTNQLILINRPHPREYDSKWQHPVLNELTPNSPSNLRIISPSRKTWQSIGLSTRDICTASDLVTTFISTVGQETALSGSRPTNKTTLGSLPLHIVPAEALNYYLPEGLPLTEIGATGVARNIEDTQTELERCLYDTNYQQQITAGQKRLMDEYRFKSTATHRVALWMRAVDKFGSNVAEALKIFK